ncbi:MAG: ABC transporter ATP-binding protein [Candidatus Izemoplasma sp.]
MNSSMNKIIELKSLSHTFGETLKVLDDISITINKNDFLTIVGPSGCGKSTLFKIITKLIKSYDGEIIIKNIKLQDSSELLGYMPQKDLLLPWRTLYKNIILPKEIAKIKVNEEEIDEYLEIFGLKAFKNHFPHQLSGGMKQRAALLRTFLMGSDIVLLDEPFAALDYLTKRKLQIWFLDVFKKLNKTVIFITHDIDEALALSNRIVVLSNLPARILKEFTIDQDIDKTDPFSPELLEIKKEIINLVE